MSAEYFDLDLAIRRIALRNVLHPDQESIVRRACRWYGEKFGIDPDEVEQTKPLIRVLLHFYEDQYWFLDDGGRELTRQDLLKTREELVAEYEKETKEKKEEDDFFESLKRQVKEVPSPTKEVPSPTKEVPPEPPKKIHIEDMGTIPDEAVDIVFDIPELDKLPEDD